MAAAVSATVAASRSTEVDATAAPKTTAAAPSDTVMANITPAHILALFMWNPLFHCIDQTRGYMFLNYDPRYTSALYPVTTTFVLIVIGLMAERYTEKHISASWNAKR